MIVGRWWLALVPDETAHEREKADEVHVADEWLIEHQVHLSASAQVGMERLGGNGEVGMERARGSTGARSIGTSPRW